MRAALERFDGCGLKATATQLVFADGAPGARIMFVGEAPGGDEDRIGRPFVGRAGQLLDRMLAAIGLDRAQGLYRQCRALAPARQPHADAAGNGGLPAVHPPPDRARRPRLLVCLGGSATQTLLGVKEGITRARGVWREYQGEDGATIPALPMFHPAYLLRSPAPSAGPGRTCASSSARSRRSTGHSASGPPLRVCGRRGRDSASFARIPVWMQLA